MEVVMGGAEILVVLLLVGRFVVEVAAVVAGLFIWERWVKQRA